jgi:hypothetical protein
MESVMTGRVSRLKAIAASAALGAAVFALAAPLAAHHSTAMFEWGAEKPMTGLTVEKWEWTNPHTFLYVRDAKGTRWAFEGMSPNHLVRYGWSRKSVAPGDKINLTYYPLKDGRKGGFNVTITKVDGKKLWQFGERGTVQ